MDIRQLRYFIAIAEEGSLSAAAQKIGVAQPSLSQHVMRLESELDVQLLDRSPRGVRLTEAGQILAGHAHTIVAALETAISEVRDRASEPQGAVSFGLPSSVGMVLSVPLAETVRHDHPKVKLRVMDAMSGYVQAWLNDGVIDLGVLYDIGGVRHLKVTPLLVEELFLIAAADSWPHPIGADGVARAPVSLRACAELPLILPNRSHGLRETIERFARGEGVELNVALEMDSLPQIKELVARGSGYSILAHSAARRELESREVVLVPIDKPVMRRTVHLVRNPVRPATRAVHEVERLALEIVAELVRKGFWRGELVFDANRPA